MNMAKIDLLDYEGRLSALEERSCSQATKEDLANLKAELITLLIGTQIALAALIICLSW